MFGSKKEKVSKQPIPKISQEMTEKIRTMPEKFYTSSGKKSGHGLFILLIVFIIVFAAIIFGAAYFFMREQNSGEPAPVPESTATPAPTPEDNGISEDIEVDATPIPEPTEFPPTQFFDASDIDNDRLSGVEERLYGTNSNSADTDSDGYSDFNELLSGYDPRLSGKTLVESGLVSSYAITPKSSILYPVSWFVRNEGVLTIFDSKAGDTITLAYFSNEEKLEPTAWIEKFDSSVFASDIAPANPVNQITAYKTRDDLKYYIFSSDSAEVFVFTYRPSLQESGESVLFSGTFLMMVNSLKIS